MTSNPHQALARRRQEHEDAMTALGLDDDAKLVMRAAVSALAKATAVSAIERLAESRRRAAEGPSPN